MAMMQSYPWENFRPLSPTQPGFRHSSPFPESSSLPGSTPSTPETYVKNRSLVKRRGSTSAVETEVTRSRKAWFHKKRGNNVWQHVAYPNSGIDYNYPNSFHPRSEDDEVDQSTPRLAEQTASIAIQSLPAQLNCIQELEDESSAAWDENSTPKFSKKGGKKTKASSQSVKKPESPKLSPAQRSKSLTHIECIDDEELVSLGEEGMESRSAEADRGGGGGIRGHRPHLAVSMVDLSRVDHRGKLQKTPSKMPSQEYFTVTFDNTEESVDLTAVQGHTLRDALQEILDDRGLDINCLHIYQEPCNTPILPHCDTLRLAGRKIRIRVKEFFLNNNVKSKVNGFQEKPGLQKKLSTGSKGGRRSGGFFGGASTDDSSSITGATLVVQGSNDGTWKSKSKSMESTSSGGGSGSGGFFGGIFTNPFKSDNDKLDALTELLDRYNQQGLPMLSGLVTFESAEDQDIFHLEASWEDILLRKEDLPERLQQQQNAIWELLQTEVNYIHQLKVITDKFKLCLCNAQMEGILQEIGLDQVFSNIQDIYDVNKTFWQEHLLPVLQEARQTRQPLNLVLSKEGFMKFDQLFQPYTKYCLDRSACLQYIKDKKRNNELFKTYVAWCETQKECNRQRFTDLIVKPMQRLTKYSLLLKAVIKRTDIELQQELTNMVLSVENFVNSVNAALRKRHEQERLATIISRIESYDVVEAKDEEVQKVLRQYLELDLTRPMPGCSSDMNRQLLLEGDLKLKDAMKNSMDVHCFLFTDMFLVCKPLNKKGRVKVVRQPYMIDRLVVHEFRERSSLLMIYLNEFQVATAVYMLSGSDYKTWLEHIRKAQELYQDAKSSMEHPSLGYLSLEDDEELDFPSHALLTARSPRSSQSSLVHSHSGSVDMSEASSGCVSHGRTVSLEFAEMRASSASSDEGSSADPRGRTQSLELRTQPPHSPIPEKKKYRFKSSSGSNSPNTLGVVNLYVGDSHSSDGNELSPTSLLVPSPTKLSPTLRSITHPPLSPRLLKRSFPVPQSCKPPLVKSKNVSSSNTGITSPGSDTQSFDFDIPVITKETITSSPDSEDENSKGKLSQKRVLRNDRRYHTADSIEHFKRDRDPSIHKRLSLNYPTTSNNTAQMSNSSSNNRGCYNHMVGKCISQESMYSSSGVSSTWSLHQSSDSEHMLDGGLDECDMSIKLMPLGPEGTAPLGTQHEKSPSLPRQLQHGTEVELAVSAIQDGISSVQIRVQDSNRYSDKDSLRRIKEFILNDTVLEASEV